MGIGGKEKSKSPTRDPGCRDNVLTDTGFHDESFLLYRRENRSLGIRRENQDGLVDAFREKLEPRNQKDL